MILPKKTDEEERKQLERMIWHSWELINSWCRQVLFTVNNHSFVLYLGIVCFFLPLPLTKAASFQYAGLFSVKQRFFHWLGAFFASHAWRFDVSRSCIFLLLVRLCLHSWIVFLRGKSTTQLLSDTPLDGWLLNPFPFSFVSSKTQCCVAWEYFQQSMTSYSRWSFHGFLVNKTGVINAME